MHACASLGHADIGLVATGGVLITWGQKNTADRRSEWWRRTAWAYERTFSDDAAQQELGWKLINVLIGSKLATTGDSDIVQVIGEHIALNYGYAEEGEDTHGDHTGQGAALHPEADAGEAV